MNKKLIKEGAEKALAAEHGYDVYSGGKWYKTEQDAKAGKGGLTSDQLWNKFGSNTHSEEVEYDGEELEESGRFTPSSPFTNRNQSRSSLSRGYKARGMEGGLPGPDNSPYGRARMRGKDLEGKMKIIKARDRAMNTMFAREFGESFDLFPKSDDRLLREHIRAEYEARGIYPTAREVQETYNQVMSLFEKTAEEERIEAHKARRGKPTKISPSSPARQQSDVEIRTRKSGIKSTDVIDMMNKLRKTNR